VAPSPNTPIERLLGPGLDDRGPFVLLGLDPLQASEADRLVPGLLAAIMARIDGHAQAHTPEADQVRLAVHTAAAQVLEPASRAAQLRLWHPEYAPPEVEIPISAGGKGGDALLSDQAKRVMAMHGGWNRDAMIALGALSSQSGASLQQVAQAAATSAAIPTRVTAQVSAATSLEQSIAASQASAAPLIPAPLAEQVDPAYRKLQSGVRVAGIGCAAMIMVTIVGFAATRCESTKVPERPVVQDVPLPPTREQDRAPLPGTLFASEGEKRPLVDSSRPAASAAPDMQAMLAQVREIRGASAADPAAASAQLSRVVQLAASSWGEWQPDQVAAFTDGLVDAVYALSRDPEWGRGAIDAIMAPTVWRQPADAREIAPRVWPSVFAAGALARLSRERDLPASVRAAVNVELTRVSATPSDMTFEAGARAGLQVVASVLSVVRGATSSVADLGPAWGKWTDGALAVAAMSSVTDPGRRSLVVLVPFEDYLRTGPDPSADKQAFESIQAIAARLDYSTSGPPREWLLRWMVSPEISSGRLFALTAKLAQEPAKSGGVDTSLVVPSAANENLRADLRDRYAKAWGVVSTQDADQLRGDWVAWTREFLQDQSTPKSAALSLAGAVAAARINEAAWLMWTGEPERASSALYQRLEPIAMAQKAMDAARPASLVDPGPPDGEWGAKYLAASLAEKRELMNAIGTDASIIGPRDCFVIVNELIKGQNAQLRTMARDRVRLLGSQAPMISTMLDVAGTLPKTREMSELVEVVTAVSLPATDDPRWRESVRRELVDRLLGVLAAAGEFGVIDLLAQQLADAYQVRGGAAAEKRPGSPEAAAGRLAVRLIKVAETLPSSGREHATLAEITQRLAGRQARERASSTGIVRQFLAQQMACFELTAYTMVTEDPTRESAVKEVVAKVMQNWTGAATSLEQARICERGICELWLVRLAPPPNGEVK
jgi:hypothetical protein